MLAPLTAADVYIMNILKKSFPELIPWLLDTAILQEAHPFHGVTWPDWVPGAARFRQHAEALTIKGKAAENKDTEKGKERDEEHEDTLISISLNANYIVMRALHEKNETLLHNMGYPFKEKPAKKSHTAASLMTTPLVLKVKHHGDGSVMIRFQKDPAAGLHQLQICKGEPAGEDSWGDGGLHKNCRIIVRELDRVNWYYFRFRCLGNNETGPWSIPVGIIVT